MKEAFFSYEKALQDFIEGPAKLLDSYSAARILADSFNGYFSKMTYFKDSCVISLNIVSLNVKTGEVTFLKEIPEYLINFYEQFAWISFRNYLIMK